MKFRILNNKKGGAPIDEAAGLILFIFIAAFGLIWIKVSNVSNENRSNEEVEYQKRVTDAHSNLMTFLNNQINNKPIAEIIVNSYYSQDYSKLDKPMKDFFNSIYSNDWVIIIEDSNKNVVLSANPNSFLVRSLVSISTTREELATAYLPLNPEIGLGYLKIRLFIIKCQKHAPC